LEQTGSLTDPDECANGSRCGRGMRPIRAGSCQRGSSMKGRWTAAVAVLVSTIAVVLAGCTASDAGGRDGSQAAVGGSTMPNDSSGTSQTDDPTGSSTAHDISEPIDERVGTSACGQPYGGYDDSPGGSDELIVGV